MGLVEHPQPDAGWAGRLRRQATTAATAARAAPPAASGTQDSVYALSAPTPPANTPEPTPSAAIPPMTGPAQQAAEVKKLRADGEALHKSGKHQESVDTLAKAMKILNIK